MPFVKLDTGILRSTLWDDRDGRDVFLTALLMAQPFEVLEPTPTLAVRTLTPTDFVIPPGWYGKVDAAGVGIVRLSLVPEAEAGMVALERLAAPDPESRSHDFEGRRLVRVDGGFIVLNYMKYRDKDHSAATRSQRYRLRKKLKETVTRDGDDTTRDVRDESLDGVAITRSITQAEAYAEAEAEKVKRGGKGTRLRRSSPSVAEERAEREAANGEASLILSQLRKAAVDRGGQAGGKVIPRAVVVALGDEIVTAYDAIGGSDRILSAVGKEIGFLRDEFRVALEAARST